MLQIDAHSQPYWVDLGWLSGGELLIWGQDCGNGHELPRVVVKSGNFSLSGSQWAPTLTIAAHSEVLCGLEADSRPGDAVLLWSHPASRRPAAAVPKPRWCVPPPKKAETFRQGRTSLTRPVLSLAGLLNKDQTCWVCASQGLLYNKATVLLLHSQQRMQLHLTYCTQHCLQRAFTAMHISSLMDDDDWSKALMPVCVYCQGWTYTQTQTETETHTQSVTFLNEATEARTQE